MMSQQDIHNKNPFQHSHVTTYDGNNERFHPLFRKDIFLFKVLLAVGLFVGISVVFKYPSDKLQTVRNVVLTSFEKEMQFAFVTDWYEDTFGKPLAFLPSQRETVYDQSEQVSGQYVVPASGILLESFEENGQGIVLKTDDGKSDAIQDGTILFAGKKEKLGNTVIIQHRDQSQSWYGNLKDLDVKLYASISKGETVGTISSEGKLFFAIKKADAFIDPSKVISFE